MRDKINVYESVLHKIQMLREVAMNKEALMELLDIIGSWSYAHRSGNGELSDTKQQERIDYQFNRLMENMWGTQEEQDAMDEKIKKVLEKHKNE